MNTKTKNILIITSVVAVGIGGYFGGKFLLNKLLKPKLNEDEKQLIEQMESANKGGVGNNSGSSNSNTSSSSNNSNKGVNQIPNDAQIILDGLRGWTTDNDEKIIVSTVQKYNPTSYKQLENHFNTKFARIPRVRMLKMSEWIEDDLSDDNFEKIKNIVG